MKAPDHNRSTRSDEAYDASSGAIGYYDEREPPVDDEPSLGGGDGRDLEADYADDEPSLGWPEHIHQSQRGYGRTEDREQCVPVGSAAALKRYRQSERWTSELASPL